MRAAALRRRRTEGVMTVHEALALTHLGLTRRRLLAGLLRTWLDRPIPEVDELPRRDDGEALVHWACRAAGDTDAAAVAARLLEAAASTLAAAHAKGQTVVPLGDPGYPPALRQIPDPPPALFVRGEVEALRWPRIVALVGARAATTAGVAMARALATGLAEAGVVVASGLARGIDSAAHRAALDRGGASIAVLGSSLDRVYPPEHDTLADRLAGQGAVVSELPPGTPPLPFHFPLRNRLISGLSAAVVVVEAAEKSGSLITAMAAAEQGREVMAVPGPVGPGRHRGGHALLRDGARLVEGPEDVLVELGWAEPASARHGSGPVLDPALARELGLDPAAPEFSTEEVATATGWPISRTISRLAALELEGKIQRIGGGRFQGTRTRVLR
jgi:DNA processing protein